LPNARLRIVLMLSMTASEDSAAHAPSDFRTTHWSVVLAAMFLAPGTPPQALKLENFLEALS
jgi:hypothetical protein